MRSVLLCFLLVFGLLTPIYGQQLKSITNSIGMKLVLIHPGSFTMGSPVGEVGRTEKERQHEVTIDESFYIGAFEVTQEEYEKVIGSNPSAFKDVRNPVETVSWDDAVACCEKLSEVAEEKAEGRKYRLPTEAEWEYACRASSTTAYSFGDSMELLEDYAWRGQEFTGKTHHVGEKKANKWRLHDMHGNVWEWCQESHPDFPTYRVFRGGSWTSINIFCRSACRRANVPTLRSHDIGFRVAMSLPAQRPKPEHPASK